MNRHDEMTTVLRPMGVLHNGVWQRCEGVWSDLDEGPKARVILNGKEFIAEGRTFADFKGYSDLEINCEIIRMNIGSLPKLPRKRHPLMEPPRERPENAVRAPQYRIVNRDGRAHAVPWPEAMNMDETTARIIETLNAAAPEMIDPARNNNV